MILPSCVIFEVIYVYQMFWKTNLLILYEYNQRFHVRWDDTANSLADLSQFIEVEKKVLVRKTDKKGLRAWMEYW